MVLLNRNTRVIADYRKGVGSTTLARKYRCSKRTILRILRNAGVERRQGNGRLRRILFTPDQVKKMLHMWKQGASAWRISLKLGVADSAVRRVLREHGIKVVPRLARFSQRKKFVGTTQGYRMVLLRPDDPFFNMCPRGKGRKTHNYVLEHRLVMARHLGRPLHPWETVHHVDGNRANNRLSNLQLLRGNHGKGYAARCKHCGSMELEYVPLGEKQCLPAA